MRKEAYKEEAKVSDAVQDWLPRKLAHDLGEGRNISNLTKGMSSVRDHCYSGRRFDRTASAKCGKDTSEDRHAGSRERNHWHGCELH